ncbi:MAG: GNAT family N-acyltransferase [Filomicrobium sp.]
MKHAGRPASMGHPQRFGCETLRAAPTVGDRLGYSRADQLAPARRFVAPRSFGRVGDLEVRMAAGHEEIRLAQALRYQVFYEEMAAQPSLTAQLRRRDEDPYDAVCDHLLVIDHAPDESSPWQHRRRPKVVGTYRVLRQQQAEKSLGFYTQGEYDIAPLIARQRHDYRFMELGRSCVLKPYRNKRTVELLWHGLWTYVRTHKVDVMLGCASFPGTDPDAHAAPLSFMYHNALASEKWRCRAHDELYVDMNRMGKDEVDPRTALRAMPPLIKGYLRLGAMVGDGAVIDWQFGTTDVMIVLPVENIDPRYFGHFGSPDEVKSRISARD